jgi:hypothetical protein
MSLILVTLFITALIIVSVTLHITELEEITTLTMKESVIGAPTPSLRLIIQSCVETLPRIATTSTLPELLLASFMAYCCTVTALTEPVKRSALIFDGSPMALKSPKNRLSDPGLA